jgi:hypothetical protein
MTLACLGLMMGMSLGCSVPGFVAQAVAGGESKVTVTAAYDGLANHSVAVLVSATDGIRAAHPTAVADTGRAVTSAIAAEVPGVHVVNPDQIARFLSDNPDWIVVPPGRLLERFGAERLVMVNLVQYSTHESGNRHLYLGRIAASVDVISADAPDLNNAVMRAEVTATYPDNGGVGVLDANDQTIALGMRKAFAVRVARLFTDYETTRP